MPDVLTKQREVFNQRILSGGGYNVAETYSIKVIPISG